MPNYDYICDCGNEREVFFRSIKAMEEAEKNKSEEITCPKCGKVMRKNFSVSDVNFILKGLDSWPTKKNKRPFG